jgi:uncharacterized protein (TIGR02145 family)
MKKMKNNCKLLTTLLSVICLLFSTAAFGQQLTPGANPHVIRQQSVDFSVTVSSTFAAANLTLEASASTGYTISPSSISGINLPADGSSVKMFTVTATCNAPQFGGFISYTLKNGSTTIATAQSNLISIDEPEFIFTPPASLEVDFVSATKTYTRVWSIKQTAPNITLNNIRIVNTCSKTVLGITKVELYSESQEKYIDVTATVLDATSFAGGYRYNFGALNFAEIGDKDGKFGTGETILIRETYKILDCGDGTSAYTFGHGDNPNYCFDTFPYTCNVSVVQPGYSPDIVNTRPITFPLTYGGIGKLSLSLCNNSTHEKAVFYDVKVPVWMNDYNRYTYTRAYLVDAAGVPLGLPDLNMLENTAIGTYLPAHTMLWVVDFSNLNQPSNATQYEAAGLHDATGDGIWNDILPGDTCYIVVEYKFDHLKGPDCPVELNPNHVRQSHICYKNSCGIYKGFTRPYLIDNLAPTTHNFMGWIMAFPPKVISIIPENLSVGDDAELYIFEDHYNMNWAESNDYEHYVIITLPEGFDYDESQQGFKISNFLYPTDKVFRTEDADGRVVLTVNNVDLYHISYDLTYRIKIFPKSSIMPDAVKTINIAHEWGYTDGSQNKRYGCHNDLPVNYRLITPYQNMKLSAFHALRMTFGWSSSMDISPATRITTANIGSYPLVRRDIAAPFDNVDMEGVINIETGFSVNPSHHWFVDVCYNGVDANEYFFFPNPIEAVKVSVNGGTPFYIPASAVTMSNIAITAGKRYTLRADLTPYTLSGYPLSNLANGDVVNVVFKTRTMEQLPVPLSQLQEFTMQTYIDEGSGAPDNKNILIKNFQLVNNAAYGANAGSELTIMNENNLETLWVPGFATDNIALSTVEIFSNEYRPNLFATYSEYKYNTLVDVKKILLIERRWTFSDLQTEITLPDNDVEVIHDAGTTTVKVNKFLHGAGYIYIFSTRIQGKFYCTANTYMSVFAHYTLYPSSENPVAGFVTPISSRDIFRDFKNYYTCKLSAVAPTVYPATNITEWDLRVTNQSVWSSTDGLLPNSWMAVTLPPQVDPASISLSDGSTTYSYSNFFPYGGSSSGKYWVKLGNLNINTFQDYKLSCNYTSCEPFTVNVTFGMGKVGYPIDPESGFMGDDAPCKVNSTQLALNAIPKLFSHRGDIVSPTPNGDNDPTRYNLCEFYTYKAIFTNTQEGVLYNPVLKLILQVGMELDHASVAATQNGAPIAIKNIIGDGPNTTERTVEIILEDGTQLAPNEIPNYQLELIFDIKAVCGITSGSALYAQFVAEDACGALITEYKNSESLFIDGISVNSAYSINNLAFTTFSGPNRLDLRSATATAATGIEITANITLTSDEQSIDYVFISVPPNMTITTVAGPTFIFNKVVAGDSVYRALIPSLNKDEYFNINVLLKPVNPALWSCDSVDVAIYTGIFADLACESINCSVEENHHNKTGKRFEVLKHDISFANADATGMRNDATSEKVIFTGTLNVPEGTNLDNVKIEVYSNASGAMLPVSGIFYTIPNITTAGSTDTYDFTTLPLIISGTDMCNLWLVIRRTENPYICDSVAIRVQNPGFKLTQENYTTCQGVNLKVGDTGPVGSSVAAYTYNWSTGATDYIVEGNPGTPVTVNYPAGVTGNQIVTLSLSRGGCNATAIATVAVEAVPFCEAPTPSQQICSGSKPNNLSINSYSGNVVRWEYSNNNFTSDIHPISNTTTTLTTAEMPALTGNTSFRAVVENTICGEVAGASVLITADPKSVGGTLSPAQTICTGETPANISLSGKTGDVVEWQSSTDNFMTIEMYFSTNQTTTLTSSEMGALTVDHYYRAIVKNGVCDPVYSNTLIITVKAICVDIICPTEISDVEGHEYKVSKIAGMCWMGENLRSTVYADGITPIAWAKPYYSVQYPDVAKHDTVFGRLYTWYSAVGNAEGDNTPPTGPVQGICPNGWHLPTVAEWDLLKSSTPVEQLKSTEYWLNPPGSGNNASGFNARPAGWCSSAINKFIELYGYTAWWAFNDDPSQFAHIKYIAYYCDFVPDDIKLKSDGVSVRCVQD